MNIAAAETRTRLARLPRPALWLIAARLKTLGLSLAPVLAGSWLAAGAGQWRPDVTAVAMLASATIQIGTNLWNDAADAARGVDQPDRLGPPRMTALGLLGGEEVRRAAFATFALAALAGLYLAGIGGAPIIAVGLASLALGYLYSMGPMPLSGLPVGEALVVAFFGVVAVSGTCYLMGVDPLAGRTLALGAMIGLPAAAVLMLNNHRDRVQDARAGRRTLAILIGPSGARLSYAAALIAGLGLGALIAPSLWLLPVAALALWLAQAVARWPISARLNRLLGLTTLYQLALLVAVALG